MKRITSGLPTIRPEPPYSFPTTSFVDRMSLFHVLSAQGSTEEIHMQRPKLRPTGSGCFAARSAMIFTCCCVLLASCGGNQSGPPPPPAPDFSLSVSSVSASAVVGNTTSVITVSATPQNGFNSTINVTLQGLPQGVVAIPGSLSL